MFRSSDDISDFDTALINKFIEISKNMGLTYLLKSSNPENSKVYNVTEVGRVIKKSKGELNGATIQFPVINYHSSSETVKIKSIKSIYSFIREFEKSVLK